MAEGLRGLRRPGHEKHRTNTTTTILKRQLLLLGTLLLLAAGARAQDYEAIARLKAMNERVNGLRSTADGEHYTVIEGDNIMRYAYAEATPGEALLPASSERFTITDYELSADERSILIASGQTPIYRHSYTSSYLLAADGRIRPVLSDATRPRDASFSPTGSRLPTRPRTTSTSTTSQAAARAASPTTAAGTRSSTARPTGSTRRSSASRRPTPSRPTAAASPTCASTRAACRSWR